MSGKDVCIENGEKKSPKEETQQNGHHSPQCAVSLDSEIDGTHLADVLIQTLLPSLSNRINLQALLVYQADGSNNRSFIINRCYQRAEVEGIEIKRKRVTDSGITPTRVQPLNDSGIDCNLDSPAIHVKDEQKGTSPLPPTHLASSSRRKRKFCRPCKIPQTVLGLPLTVQTFEKACATPKPEALLSQPIMSSLLPESDGAPLQNNRVETNHPMTVSTVDCSNSAILTALSKSLFTSNENPQQHHQQPIFLSPTLTFTTPIPVPLSTATVLPMVNTMPINGPRPIRPRIAPSTTNAVTSLTNTPAFNSGGSIVQPVSTENQQNDSTESEDSWAVSRRYAKSFACNQCRCVFGSLNALCEHTYAMHKAFRCMFCQAQFTQRSNLQRHSLRHVGFKPFICGVCNKDYYRKDHLVRHIEVAHPTVDVKASIIAKVTSADCLDYLDTLTQRGLPDLPKLGAPNTDKRHGNETREAPILESSKAIVVSSID